MADSLSSSGGNSILLDAEPTEVSRVRPDERLRRRWAVLACAALMPIGVHVCYKMTGGLEKDLIKDGFAPQINHAQYGLLNSAVSWVNLGFPFLIGILLDVRSTGLIAILSASMACAGQVIFTIGVYTQNFPIALAGRFVFGVGEGSIMIAQGAMCSQWFNGAELTFAFGICEMTHNLANFVGKIAVNIGLALGGWRTTLWFGVVLCILGLIVTGLFAIVEKKTDVSRSLGFQKHGAVSCKGCAHLRDTFWLVCLLHMLVSNVEHLFDTISADFVRDKWHSNTTKAAWLSSLNYVFAIGLCPLVGLFLDVTSRRMLLAAIGCMVMGGAHLLLGLTHMNPAIGLVLLSLPEAVLPTILRSCVPLVVSPSAYGVAFGVYEIAESLGKTAGSPLVGWVRDATENYTADEVILFCASFAAAALCFIISFADWRHGGALNAGPKDRRAHCERLRLQDVTEIGAVRHDL